METLVAWLLLLLLMPGWLLVLLLLMRFVNWMARLDWLKLVTALVLGPLLLWGAWLLLASFLVVKGDPTKVNWEGTGSMIGSMSFVIGLIAAVFEVPILRNLLMLGESGADAKRGAKPVEMENQVKPQEGIL